MSGNKSDYEKAILNAAEAARLAMKGAGEAITSAGAGTATAQACVAIAFAVLALAAVIEQKTK